MVQTEVLDARIFNNLIEVREITEEWLTQYNNERPHKSLGNLSPIQYLLKTENSPKHDSIFEFPAFQHQQQNKIFYSFTKQNVGIILSNVLGDLHLFTA